MPLLPPRSRSAQVQAQWLGDQPSDESYLSAAYDYLDATNADYVSWKARKGYSDPTFESNQDFQRRAIRLAEAWRELGWTNGDVQNFLDMSPSDRANMARSMAIGRQRRGGGDMPLSDEEAALFYHGG